MVIQIFDDKTLKEEILNHREMSVGLSLSMTEIDEWKEKGKFVFLKRELANLPGLKFSCAQHGNIGCTYYFICNTKALHGRLVSMMDKLYNQGTKVPLVKCNYASHELIKSAENNMYPGDVKACTLF